MSWVTDWLTAIGTVGATLMAVRGVSESKKYRLAAMRPVVVFEALNVSGSARQIVSNATFWFQLRNDGQGVAILGDNPFRALRHTDMIVKIYRQEPVPQMIVRPIERLPGTIPPEGTVDDVRIAILRTGNNNIFETPTAFTMFYSDMGGRELWTKVSIDPGTGEILGLEFGPSAGKAWSRFVTWWKRMAES